MNKTKIEWCDYTWNPITGCSEISEGCQNCYAKELSRRFGWHWGKTVMHKRRLNEPHKVKTPGKVFVCSMSDLGHQMIYGPERIAVADAMRDAPWHQYIVLTKRPGGWIELLPENCWVGVTVETQRHLAERVDTLNAHCGHRVRFLSLEPLLEPIALTYISGVDWVIAGPETGRGARPCKNEWINDIGNECGDADVPFFDKRKTNWMRREWPEARTTGEE